MKIRDIIIISVFVLLYVTVSKQFFSDAAKSSGVSTSPSVTPYNVNGDSIKVRMSEGLEPTDYNRQFRDKSIFCFMNIKASLLCLFFLFSA